MAARGSGQELQTKTKRRPERRRPWRRASDLMIYQHKPLMIVGCKVLPSVERYALQDGAPPPHHRFRLRLPFPSGDTGTRSKP